MKNWRRSVLWKFEFFPFSATRHHFPPGRTTSTRLTTTTTFWIPCRGLFGCDLSCEYHSLSILLCWSAKGRNDGFENVTVLKWESCTRTQSRTRSQIWRSLLVWLSLLLGDSHCIGRNKEKLFECTCKTDEWQIWWRTFISEKNKWKQDE